MKSCFLSNLVLLIYMRPEYRMVMFSKKPVCNFYKLKPFKN